MPMPCSYQYVGIALGYISLVNILYQNQHIYQGFMTSMHLNLVLSTYISTLQDIFKNVWEGDENFKIK
jgi:hypothetical protein